MLHDLGPESMPRDRPEGQTAADAARALARHRFCGKLDERARARPHLNAPAAECVQVKTTAARFSVPSTVA